MEDLILTIAQSPNPQRDVGRAFLLLTVLIIVGVLIVLGVVLAGFAYFARANAAVPKRRDPHAGVDPWTESARRTTEADPDEPEDEEDWEADEED